MHVIRERYFPLLNCDVYFANVQVCVYLCVCVCARARAHARESPDEHFKDFKQVHYHG